MNQDWQTVLLQIAIFAPLAGIPLIALVQQSWAKTIALLLSSIPLVGGIVLHWAYSQGGIEASETGYVFYVAADWLVSEGVNIQYLIGVDGISAYMLLLTALLFPILVIYNWNKQPAQERLFYAMLLLLETGLLGFFVSLDLLLFYVFFELVLIPTAFFIGIWGGERRNEAALKFFLYTLAGSLLMLIAILYLGVNVAPDYFTTNYFEIREALTSGAFSATEQTWLFLGFFLAFAIKVPLFPLHTWQALTYSQANTTGSVILAALLSKMGAYGLIRLVLPFFPTLSVDYAPVISALAVVSILYGAYLAVVQTDLKRLIAFSSLSHLGFIVLGIFAMTPEAMSGAVLQMFAHGVSTAAMFLMAGMLMQRQANREISAFQGVASLAPKFALLFMISVMASVGLPGLSGFVGEFMILIGAFDSGVIGGIFAVLSALAVVIAAVYLLNMFRKTMFGESNDQMRRIMKDLQGREVALLMPLVILMFVIGLWATPFLKQINPGSERVLEQVGAAPAMSDLQEYLPTEMVQSAAATESAQ